MKKNNFKKTVLALSLTAVLGLGGTLAYLTATTGDKVNNFTSDNTKVDGKTTEDFDTDKASTYKPGDVIAKAPTVSLDENSESAYVALKVAYVDSEGNHLTAEQFSKLVSINDLNTTDWTLANTAANGDQVFVYKTVVAKGTSANKLFNKVTVNAGITTVKSVENKTVKHYVKNADGSYTLTATETSQVKAGVTYYDQDGNVIGEATGDGSTAATKLPSFKIIINGYAVQSDNNNLTDATAELVNMAK